ncbi:MAG: universal stress protein [Chloroflexota bacterium]
MTRILACVDGSRFSASVLDHAAWAARRINASVEVIHVLDRPHATGRVTDFSGAMDIDFRESLLEELTALDEQRSRLAQKQGWLILDEARARLTAAGVPTVEVHQLQGTVVDSITEMEADADLVVIGKRGASEDSARHHLGSNLERVVRASKHPVLVAAEEFRPIERVLLAYDGGPSSQRAIERFARSQAVRDLACHLLMVGHEDVASRRILDTAAATLREAGYAVSASIEPGHVEQVIPAQIRQRQIDLLVMGAYGHSRIRELIIGSTTTAMLGVSPVSVLLFR